MIIITKEVLINKQLEVPVITGVYDLLTRKRDGTITSQAPIIVSGKHLDMLQVGNIKLCIAPAIDPDAITEVVNIYKHTDKQVIVSLPLLIPGEYLPVMRIMKEGQEEVRYIFPVTWIVQSEEHGKAAHSYSKGRMNKEGGKYR